MKDIQFDKSETKKILVIKPRAIGDVLLSTPVLPNLREEFPCAQIDFLLDKFASDVMIDNPYVDNVIVFDTRTQSPISIITLVRQRRYDLVIDLFANPRTAIITMLSGARYRVGFPFKWRKVAYNILVHPRSGQVHNIEFNLDALRRIGIPIKFQAPAFYLNDKAKSFAEGFLKSHNLSCGRFITINIGGGWKTKRLPAKKAIELCDLIEGKLSFPAVVLYGSAEINEAQHISESTNAILAPPTSLHEMGAIMKESLLLITNDSGPMHIAAALGVPTLAIFGPTSPHLQGPYGNISEIVRNEELDCLECNLTRCPIVDPVTGIGNPCMKELKVELIFEKLAKLISKVEHSSPALSSTELRFKH